MKREHKNNLLSNYILIYVHMKLMLYVSFTIPMLHLHYYCRPPDHKCDIGTNQANYCLLKYDSIHHVQKDARTADS